MRVLLTGLNSAHAAELPGCIPQVQPWDCATPIARNSLFKQELPEEMEFTAAPRASKPVLCKQTPSEIGDADQVLSCNIDHKNQIPR